MRMPFAGSWRAQADSKATSIDPAATVAFGPDMPRVTGPFVAANRRVCRSNHGHTQPIRIFDKSGIALVVITANSGIRRGDYARAGFVLLHGKAKGAFDLVSLNMGVCRRYQSFASLALLAETGYTSPLIANDDGVQWLPYQFTFAAVSFWATLAARSCAPRDNGLPVCAANCCCAIERSKSVALPEVTTLFVPSAFVDVTGLPLPSVTVPALAAAFS